MNRIRLILVVAHLCWFVGGLTFYIKPSWVALGVAALGICMRWMVPLSKEKKHDEPKLGTILFINIWFVSLLNWLNTKGMREVIERAIDDRLNLVPILLIASLLISFVVRDWLHLNDLSTEEVDLYYTKTKKA